MDLTREPKTIANIVSVVTYSSLITKRHFKCPTIYMSQIPIDRHDGKCVHKQKNRRSLFWRCNDLHNSDFIGMAWLLKYRMLSIREIAGIPSSVCFSRFQYMYGLSFEPKKGYRVHDAKHRPMRYAPM